MIEFERYESLVKEASILKAEAENAAFNDQPFSDAEWKRILAYHNAADLELKALDLLHSNPVEAVASHLAEAIALYERAEDPESAMHHLSNLKDVAGQSPDNKYIQSILSTITPRIVHNYNLYDQKIKIIPISPMFRRSIFENVAPDFFDGIIKRFRGAWNLWWMRHFIAMCHDDMPGALDSLGRARDLHPWSEQLIASSLLFYTKLSDAEEALLMCRRELEHWKNSSIVNLSFAISVLSIHRGKIRRSRLREAVEAVLAAKSLEDPQADEMLLLIAESFLSENSRSMPPEEKIAALMRLVEDKVADDAYTSFRRLDIPAWLINQVQPRGSSAGLRARR